MTTEDKIREAFNEVKPQLETYDYDSFRTGVMWLLNELEPSSFLSTRGMLYRLPEGVTKP